jgi:hypothetical protein
MVLHWKRFTVVGVAALALALAALGGSIGQAEPGANWLVKGTKVSALLKPKVLVQEVEETEKLPLRVLFFAFGMNMDYRCAKLEPIEFALLTEGSSTGKILFSGCKLVVEGMEIAACAPEIEGKFGLVETVKLKALLVLHKLKDGTTDPLIRVEPSEGKIFATFFASEECNFGGGTIGGVVYLKDHNGKLSTEGLTHLLEEGPLTKIYFVEAEHPATLDGKVVLGLSGEHSKLNWSGLPG